MKPKVFALMMAAVCTALPLAACATGEAPEAETPSVSVETQKPVADYKKLTAEEAMARMEAQEGALVVDVRTREEYDAGHIEGAILLPNETIGDAMPAELPDLDAEILIYCRSGNRSAQAARKLIALGYTQVYDFGGIIDWPYETVMD